MQNASLIRKAIEQELILCSRMTIRKFIITNSSKANEIILTPLFVILLRQIWQKDPRNQLFGQQKSNVHVFLYFKDAID